jgi:multiple sugar transport system substrate-binding protein
MRKDQPAIGFESNSVKTRENNMKRGTTPTLVVLLLLTAPLVVLGTAQPDESASSMSYEGTELQFGMDYVEMVGFVEDLTEEFEQETGIKVTVELIPYLNYRDKIILDLSSKSGNYNLMQTAAMWMEEFVNQADYLEPLNDYLEDSRFPDPQVDGIMPNLWKAYNGEYQNKVYGFPFIPDGMVFLYNKKMFAEVGLSEPPKTWEDVYEYGKKLTRDTDGDGKVDQYGLALMAGGRVQTAVMYTALLFAYGGSEYDADGNPSFATEAGVKAMDMFVKLLEIAPPAALESDLAETVQQMAQGLTAMAVSWPTAVLVPLEDPEKSKVVGDIAYSAPPNESSIIGGFSVAISQFIPQKEKEASYLFLNWFSSPEIDKRKALAGLTPIRTATYQDDQVFAQYPYLREFKNVLAVGTPFSSRPGGTDAWKYIQDYSTKAFLGQASPQEVVQQMNAAVQEMFDSR